MSEVHAECHWHATYQIVLLFYKEKIAELYKEFNLRKSF